VNGGSDSLLECFCNTLGALLPVFVIQGDKRKGEEDHEIENERIQRNHAGKGPDSRSDMQKYRPVRVFP
jgi:hypothetical protein